MPRAAGVARKLSAMSEPPDESAAGRWYEGGLPFSCTGCGNCCKSHGEYSHVYLREEEAKAIAEHLGMELGDFAAAHLQIQDGWLLLRQGDTQCQGQKHTHGAEFDRKLHWSSALMPTLWSTLFLTSAKWGHRPC